MKKLLFPLFLFLSCPELFSQMVLPLRPVINSIYGDTIFTVAGGGFYSGFGSNSINNSFASAIYNSEYLDENLIASNKLRGKNIIGAEMYSDCYVTVMPDSLWKIEKLGYRFGLSYRKLIHVNYPDDVFNIVLYGNKDYAGRSAIFDGTRFRLLNFQEFQAGFFRHFSDGATKTSIYFGMNLLKGQQLQYINISKGDLFTAQDGTMLSLDAGFQYFTSDPGKKRIYHFNGAGISFNSVFIFENVKSGLTFSFSSRDLGYIAWSKGSYYNIIDTILTFEGVEINDFLAPEESDYDDLTLDSLKEIYNSFNDTIPFYLSLPERINLEIKKSWKGIMKSTAAGFTYIFNTGQPLPQFYLIQDFQVKPWCTAAFVCSYGGFSLLSGGISVEMVLKKKFIFTLQSADISGYIIPENTFSKSLFFGFRYEF